MSDQQLNAGKQQDSEAYQRQVELESWSQSVGAGRVLSGRWEKAAAGSLGNAICRPYLEQVLAVYEKSRHQPGRQAMIWELMHDEKSVVQVALESLFWMLGNIHEERSYNQVCAQLGRRAEYTLWLSHPVWSKSLHLKGLKLASNGDMGMDLIVKRLKDKGFQKAAMYKPLSQAEKIALGAFFVECIEQCTHMIEVVLVKTARSNKRVIRYTEVYWGYLRRWKEIAMLFRPLHMPMSTKPRPYSTALDGGYETLRMPVSTVDPGLFYKQFRRAKPGVLGALNTLQEQAYQLDREQIDLQRQAWELGHEIGGLPKRDRMPKPVDAEYKALGLGPSAFWKAHWQWRADQRKDHLRSRFVNALIAYDRVKEFTDLYLVHHLDHRGRVYSRGAQLNVQGGDLFRSTFQFKEKGPMKGHEKEFAWSLGEAIGLPPIPETRENYLREHSSAIKKVGDDPLGALAFWAEQKEPWRLIQLCRDWAQYLDDPGYTTGTIHWLDQTSSGYGHAACLLLDQQLAKFTNVIGAKPADLYYGAGKVCEARLKSELSKAEDPKRRQLLEWWINHKPGRALWKKCFMPIVYGRTYAGLQDVVVEYLRNDQQNFLTDEGLRILDLARLLTAEAYIVSKEVMPGVLELQKWLGKLAALQMEAGHRPHWYTPDGLMIESYSSQTKIDEVKLTLSNRTVRIHCRTNEGAPIDKKKSVSGLCAHYVHSQDGAFLRKFVNHWATYGHPISTVHDCFGTTINKVGMMRHELNDQWARFYSVDWLSHLQGFVEALTGQPVPAPPFVGTLDRGEIGENPFLFT